ncbi:anaphase-promoting complex subunit 10 [Nematocida minor]|uniref:anaphase-promoting complex subunit 10 n=1 Tax=Nematocida minor TaxID=1912983 RepID=UPI00221EEA42|nr:anaphase-promoting complex subunit 10 [Nematocida minor]KAI5192215.1 anaphase-promoting complex subunit 10 [Nematocida minor]
MEARLSTYKTGHGPEELFSESLEQFWHTDGNLPHYIEIEFHEIKRLAEIKMNLGHTQDKSYIPKEIEIRCGKTRDTIEVLKTVLISDKMPVVNISINEDCCYLQIIILSNHQEGRDSRIRGLTLSFQD